MLTFKHSNMKELPTFHFLPTKAHLYLTSRLYMHIKAD